MAKKKDELVPIGKKIRKIRLDKKISFDFLANETGLSIDFIKTVESGKQRPSVGNLLQISRALGIDSGFFLKEQEESIEDREKASSTRTDNYAYTPLSAGSGKKHLKPFQISIDAGENHKGVGFQHEGEEFVYVLKGSVDVTVGDHINSLKTGDSLHFNSGVKHNLKNTGNDKAELIVIVYSP